MRRKTLSAVLVVALWLGAASPGMAASFLLFEEYGGTWQDVNKSPVNPDDDLMCWAAAAANVLAWGNWGTTAFNTADKIFQHYVDHWTNNVGQTYYAWRWWFDGSSPTSPSRAVVNVPGGGGFYPDLSFTDYYLAIWDNVMAAIDTALHQGYGVTITVIKGGTTQGHVLTVWGLDYDYTTLGKTYRGIYVTDSDDGYFGLNYYAVNYRSNAWWLSGFYEGWYFNTAGALLYNSTPIVTPLPSSLLLFSSGIVGVGLVLRRRRARQLCRLYREKDVVKASSYPAPVAQ